ncbi:alkane 1-monooxygenase [Thalassovita taeanensis]|uniref:Alkane 1-monooxygenase n=1 Tax=Thalassovita taeanensis TaxID=657014 RepID=A0A1H9ESI1_9RHOB|nr:alkane 1-monooxygenase [Thalassovita taeanensis]SEQ28575.1 alkane 1-monooxygenase [Thalassovita taeanensis]
MLLFSLATLTPALLLALGSVWGGIWIGLAVLFITVFVFAMDRLGEKVVAQTASRAEFPSGDGLSVMLGLLHLPLLGLAVWSLSGASALSAWERIGLWVGYGLFFGQVAHPNAHELIHRSNRWLRGLGKMVYITLLIGHHASAHPKVHHIHVATDQDPSSARLGEGFWRFARRSWIGAFRAGWQAETRMRGRLSPPPPAWSHPYAGYIGGAVATLAAAFVLARAPGVIAVLAVATYAQLQMLLSDYVQHYGLRRPLREDGRPEPVGPQHSWNTPHWFSSAMMLNAPRHSDHHMHPTRPYPALQLEATMPILPHSLPVMAVIALWPGLWRRLMDPRTVAVMAPAAGGGKGG